MRGAEAMQERPRRSCRSCTRSFGGKPIRSERQLMKQRDYNLLYPWFVGLTSDDAVRLHQESRLPVDSNLAEAFLNQVPIR